MDFETIKTLLNSLIKWLNWMWIISSKQTRRLKLNNSTLYEWFGPFEHQKLNFTTITNSQYKMMWKFSGVKREESIKSYGTSHCRWKNSFKCVKIYFWLVNKKERPQNWWCRQLSRTKIHTKIKWMESECM